MVLVTIFLIAIFGLIIGSFVGALSYRLPREVSILQGRSVCDRCKTKISAFDNIPLFSYLMLKGKCRHCAKNISSRYPLIEFFTALVFVLVFLTYKSCHGDFGLLSFSTSCGWSNYLGIIAVPLFLLVMTFLVVIFVIDLEHQIIFDELTYTLFFIVFVAHLFSSKSLYIYLLSAFASGLFLLILHLFTKGKGMGLGDVKFALLGGLFFGYPHSITWLFLSFLIGAVVGLGLMGFGKAKFGMKIPFGPFLIISFVIVFLWGEKLSRLFIPYLY